MKPFEFARGFKSDTEMLVAAKSFLDYIQSPVLGAYEKDAVVAGAKQAVHLLAFKG